MHLPINCRKSGQVLTSVTLVASNMSGRGKGGSLRSRRTKRRGWGEEGKRATSGKKMGGGREGERERLLQRPLLVHFCGRWRPQNSDWLIGQ